MKKVLLLIVMAGYAAIAQAQIKYGVKAGANLSNAGDTAKAMGDSYKMDVKDQFKKIDLLWALVKDITGLYR